MKPYPQKNKHVRSGDKKRCVNPHCGKWTELYLEKTCPGCGKRSVERADKRRCDDCHAMLTDGDPVCPLCGSKQRTIAELRGLEAGKLTDFTHLLREARPSVSLKECRGICRSITAENPYRISFNNHPEKIQPFLQRWKALGGTAAACLPRETARRPVVMLRTFNYPRQAEHARLLFRVKERTNLAALSSGEVFCLLHGLNREETPFKLIFTSGFEEIENWVAAWRKLGGTAARSGEHPDPRIPEERPADRSGRSQVFFRDPDVDW